MSYDLAKITPLYKLFCTPPALPDLKAFVYQIDSDAPTVLVVEEHRHLVEAAVQDPGRGMSRVTVSVIPEEEFFKMRRHLRGTGIRYPQGVQVTDCERLTLGFTCPVRWQELQATSDPLVRHCTGCSRDIHFVADALEMEFRRRRGDCVAIQVEEELFIGIPFMDTL